jgi:hypothetical protein
MNASAKDFDPCSAPRFAGQAKATPSRRGRLVFSAKRTNRFDRFAISSLRLCPDVSDSRTGSQDMALWLKSSFVRGLFRQNRLYFRKSSKNTDSEHYSPVIRSHVRCKIHSLRLFLVTGSGEPPAIQSPPAAGRVGH